MHIPLSVVISNNCDSCISNNLFDNDLNSESTGEKSNKLTRAVAVDIDMCLCVYVFMCLEEGRYQYGGHGRC